MTDNEIIKALMCCSEADNFMCKGMTYEGESLSCLFKETLDFINRQDEKIKCHRAEVEELRFRIDQTGDERSKIGIMFEETLKENEDLKKKVEFLSGQCEAYKYCISKMGGD